MAKKQQYMITWYTMDINGEVNQHATIVKGKHLLKSVVDDIASRDNVMDIETEAIWWNIQHIIEWLLTT